ncbi:protein FAR-RED ELONGATED HYPOCOTYL 3-like [Tripterygium wilfordii]|uniref:protein FAR-RED ELONGATED HYPOCOTYL 3-like n=1 Tax=Tripterygium wilfordii TaxID=458696 RepID=UPI0018F8278C|nr:protein FAR-RED ELONGATED HYPOCOTYL 3-like [Tripterygium wilfordii]
MLSDFEVAMQSSSDSSSHNMVAATEVEYENNPLNFDDIKFGTKSDTSNVPMVGMLFNSPNDIFEFYKAYGQVKGFSIKRRSISKDNDGQTRYLNECKARIFGRISIDGKWEITMFEEKNNHELIPGRLRNLFWTDPRTSAAYEEFDDVVTFDTTYLTNKYDMPFAPFVGVNHHGHSILLGCGLISSEDTKTFVWLFKIWLACMGGVAPQGIITDQDRAMKNAIQVVFPNTRHRWYLWHIMKKVPEKLGSYRDYNDIKKLSTKAVYDSRSSTFFDGYVHSKTTLKQFVEQYENALRKKVEKERQADFESFNKQLACSTFYDVKKQMRDLYTAQKFFEFQKEMTGMMYCRIKSISRDEFSTQYIIYEDIVYGEGAKKKVTFSVTYNEVAVSCSCLRFEFRGIMCRHALSVLIYNDHSSLPNHYVFRRWRKDVRRSHSCVKLNFDGCAVSTEQHRYDEMCKSFTSLAELASENEVYYPNVMQWIDVSLKNTTVTPTTSLLIGCSNSNDPIAKRGKGRPPSVMKK